MKEPYHHWRERHFVKGRLHPVGQRRTVAAGRRRIVRADPHPKR